MPGLATRVSLRLARLPRTASSAQRSRRLCSTRAAALVLVAHTEVTKTKYFFQAQSLGAPQYLYKYKRGPSHCGEPGTAIDSGYDL